MRWSVESSDDEDRRRNAETKIRMDAARAWHRHFAWLPVRVSPQEERWLETVERRLTPYWSRHDATWWTEDIWQYEYRALKAKAHG